MKEHKAQTIVTHYFTARPQTCLYEVKVARRGKFYFSQLEDQQVTSLYNAKYGGLHHKISDESTGHKPGDGFCLHKAEAWVIIFYTKERKFLFLDIDTVIAHKEKALDFSGALSIASKVVEY